MVRGGAVLRLLWQLLWNVVALFRTSQPRPPSFLFKQSWHQTVSNCNVKKTSIGCPLSPAGSVEQRQGESGLIVRDHVSISRSDWTLGAGGKSLSLQIIKVLLFYTKTQIKNSSHHISLSRWGNRSGQIRISSDALKKDTCSGKCLSQRGNSRLAPIRR